MSWFLELLGTFGVGVASALIPVINIEAYLVALAATTDVHVWWIAIAAALGQMLGKLVYYYLGRASLGWSWVRKHTDSERFQNALTKWQGRIGDRPWLAAAVLFSSATLGIPPLAVLAVLAGALRIPVPLFLTVGTVGRILRLAAFLGGAAWFFS